MACIDRFPRASSVGRCWREGAVLDEFKSLYDVLLVLCVIDGKRLKN